MLGPGEFEYKFWVDGNWVVDPNNRRTRLNSFGTFNSIISIAPEKSRRK
ncbi:MAG: glycogen-binding domain-containing protein [Desulfobacteraceae bacterium]|nr:glycogen-binding domain-containing protein [Desulfobacteraceae bacterium]